MTHRAECSSTSSSALRHCVQCASDRVQASTLLTLISRFESNMRVLHGVATRNNVAATLCALLLCGTIGTEAIRCYQCSSDTDPKGEDLCGAYTKFDKERNVPIECNSEESHMPGTFCVKLTKQSQRGFIWDGRWRQVIRRCASVASTGVTGVCNWGVHENGDYWQECYCSEDSCNTASTLTSLTAMLLVIVSGVVAIVPYFE